MIRSRVKIKAIVLLLIALHVKAAPNRSQDVQENISNVNVTSSDNNTSQSSDSSPTIVKLSILHSNETDGKFKSTNPQYDMISAIKSSANLMHGSNYGIMFNAPTSVKEPAKTSRRIVKTIKKNNNDGSPATNRNSRVTTIQKIEDQIPVIVEIINKTDGDNLQTHHKWSIQSDNMTLNNTIIIGANTKRVKLDSKADVKYTISRHQIEEEERINKDRYYENIKEDELINKKLLEKKIEAIKFNAALALSDNSPDPPKNQRGKIRFAAENHDNGQHKKENEEHSDNYPDITKFNQRVEELQSGRFASNNAPDSQAKPKLFPYMRTLLAKIAEEKALLKLSEQETAAKASEVDEETPVSSNESNLEKVVKKNGLRFGITQPTPIINEDVPLINTKAYNKTSEYDESVDYTKYITPAKRPLIRKPEINKVSNDRNIIDVSKNSSTNAESSSMQENADKNSGSRNKAPSKLTTVEKNRNTYVNGNDYKEPTNAFEINRTTEMKNNETQRPFSQYTTADKNRFTYINGDDLDDTDVKKNHEIQKPSSQYTTADKNRFTYINGEDLDDKDVEKNHAFQRPSSQYSTADKNRFTYSNGGDFNIKKENPSRISSLQYSTANRNKFLNDHTSEESFEDTERNKTADSILVINKIKENVDNNSDKKENYESKYQSTVEKLEKINKNKITTSDPKIIDVDKNTDNEDSYDRLVDKEIKTISSLIDARKKYIQKEILETNDEDMKKNITAEVEALEKITAAQVHSKGIDQIQANANDKNYLKTPQSSLRKTPDVNIQEREVIHNLRKDSDNEEKIRDSYSAEEYSKRKHIHTIDKELYTITTLINNRKEHIQKEVLESQKKDLSKNITDEIKSLETIKPLQVYLEGSNEKRVKNDLKTSQSSYRRLNSGSDDDEDNVSQLNKIVAKNRGQSKYIPSKFETISPFISDTNVNKIYSEHGIVTEGKTDAEITRERGILKYEISTQAPKIDIQKNETSAVSADINRVSSSSHDTNTLHSRRPSDRVKQTTSNQMNISTANESLKKDVINSGKITQDLLSKDNKQVSEFGIKRVSSSESIDIKNESELVKNDEIGKASIKTSLEINQGQTKKDDKLGVELVGGQNTKASTFGILANKHIVIGNDAKSGIIKSHTDDKNSGIISSTTTDDIKNVETLKQVKFVNRLNIANTSSIKSIVNENLNLKSNATPSKSIDKIASDSKVPISKSDVKSDSPTTFNLNIYPTEKSATPISGESVTKLQDVTKIMTTVQTSQNGQDISTKTPEIHVESRENDQGLDISGRAVTSRGGKDYMEMAENFRGFTSFGLNSGFGKSTTAEKSDVTSDLSDGVEFSKYVPESDDTASPKSFGQSHNSQHRGDQYHYHIRPDEYRDRDDHDYDRDHHKHNGGNRDHHNHKNGDRDRDHHRDGDRDHHRDDDRDRDRDHHRRPGADDDDDDDIKYILAEKRPYHYDTDKVSYDKNGNIHYGIIHGDDDDKCHKHKGEKLTIGTFAPDESPIKIPSHHHNLPEPNILELTEIDGSKDRDGPDDGPNDRLQIRPHNHHSHHIFDEDSSRKITGAKSGPSDGALGQESKHTQTNYPKEGDTKYSNKKNTNQKRGSIKYDWNAMRSDWNQDDDSDFPAEFGYKYETPTGISAYQKGVMKKIDNKRVFVVRGSYQYTSPDGTPVTVHYTADETGFHPHVVAPNIANAAN